MHRFSERTEFQVELQSRSGLLTYRYRIGFLGCLLSLMVFSPCFAGVLKTGGATVSITPDRPVALWGQMQTRISQGVESPITATILVLESQEEGEPPEQVVAIACDLVAIPLDVLALTRTQVQKRIPDFPVAKIVMSGTHTHTAPVMSEGMYEIPKEGVMQPGEYNDFFAERVAEGVVQAWNSRKPAKVGWGLGHAFVAQNRRSVYADGTAVMYGRTHLDNFRMFEGYEDHGVEVLFFWDESEKLVGTAINLACPSQEVEGNSFINADFWHQVRETLRAEYGPQLNILAWTGAGGDQSPHLMFRKQAEERMMKLRKINRLNEISRRIVMAWKEAYEGAKQEMHTEVTLKHRVQQLQLPRRVVTEREYLLAKSKVEEYSKEKGKQTSIWWHGEVVKRYEDQVAGKVEPYEMELHVIRVGDVAITTNPFELYTDFGIQMKARSPALQTFVIQLAGPGTYLASERAVLGGGYSAIVESNVIGPEGGQVLTEKTIEVLNTLWPAVAK